MRINLAKDPSLRSGTAEAYSSVQGGALEVTEDYSFYGKYGLSLTKTVANGSGVRIADPVPVVSGLPYAFSWHVRLPITIPRAESAEVVLNIGWMNSLGAVIRTDTSASLIMDDDSTWYRLGGVWVAPPGATFATVSAVRPLPGAEGTVVILDALLIEQADYIGGYFDNISQAEKNRIVNKSLSALPQVINGIRLGADISLNNHVFNTIDEEDTVWVVTELDGWWGQTAPELPDIARGTEDGSYDVEGRLTARTITLSGFFIPKDTEDSLTASIDRLVDSINLVRKGGWLHANEGPTKAAWVRLAGRPSVRTVNARGKTEFQITLRAGDPIKYHWNDSDPEGYTSGEYRSSDIIDESTVNLFTNPNFVGNGTRMPVYENLFINPGFEAGSGTVEVRRNLWADPVPTSGVRTNGLARWGQNHAQVTVSIDGDGWLRAEANTENTDGTVLRAADWGAGGMPLPASTTITHSFEMEMKPGLPDPIFYRYEYDASNAMVVSNARSDLSVAPDGRYYVTFTTTATTAKAVLVMRRPTNNWAVGDWYRFRHILQEKSETVNPYFTPGTPSPDSDLTASWAGTANASESVLTGVGVANQNATTAPLTQSVSAIQSGVWAESGAYSMRLTNPTAANGFYQVGGYNFTVFAPGKTYTVMGTLRLSAPLAGTLHGSALRLEMVDSRGGSHYVYDTAPNEAGEHPLRITFTVPATGASWVTLRLWHGGVSGDVWWDNVLAVEGVYNGPWFDGNNPHPDPDFQTEWTGAANASRSRVTGEGVAGITASRVVPIRSSEFGGSMRLIPTDKTTNDSSAEMLLPAGHPALAGGTAIATMNLKAPLTGPLGMRARRLSLFFPETNSPSAEAPNVAGSYPLRVDYPPLNQVARLRFNHGGFSGSGDVYWTMGGLFEGGYDGPWFDGDTLSTSTDVYGWTGEPNASTSTRSTYYEDVVDNIGTAEVSGLFTITGPVGAGTRIYNATTDETMTLQEPLRGAGMVANVDSVESTNGIATIYTTAPHGLRVGDEISLLGMVIPFSETDQTRLITHASDVFPYSFSFAMPTDDISKMTSDGQVVLVNNDVLVVDTYNRSVTYNGEVSGHRYRLTTLTDWIHFAPGRNLIEYHDSATRDEVISKQITDNTVTLVTEDAHYLIPGEEVEVNLPVEKALRRKSLTGNVVTLTTAEPHGFAVGDVVDVASTETAQVITKSRTGNVATLTTSEPHGVAVSDSVKVALPTTMAPNQKSITSNVARLTTQHAHGFSVGDEVSVALPTSATIVSKQLTNNQVILTTSASHNFSIGDSITVTMPSGATVTGKSRSGSQIIITTSAAHGFSVGDQVIMSLPTTAAPSGTLSADATSNLVTITTSAAHGFSVGDRVLISGSPISTLNGERVVETVPSTSSMTFRDWSLSANSSPSVGSTSLTNLTNQSYNGTRTLVAASGTTFSYNL